MFEIPRPIPAARPQFKNALRPLGALLAALALLVGLAGPAAAESTTVSGAAGGPLKKMFVSNGTNAVVAKVHGPGKTCDRVRWVKIRLRDGDGTKYAAIGACYPGDPASGGGWKTSLETDSALVSCDGFTLTYDGTANFWRFQVPRSCLTELANRIKVSGELVTTTSAIGGEAGPTPWLSRG